MPRIDVVVETKLTRTARAKQLEAMFDVPPSERASLEWHVDLPDTAEDWQIGAIVGPSGCGKTTIARAAYGREANRVIKWPRDKGVIDAFPAAVSMEDISNACMSVGFNTIPAWLRPFHVLSNGEQFRATLARRLIDSRDVTVIDEFSSVVDRQVAKIASHAVQKFVRRSGRKFVAVTCHYDVLDWLRPDWVYDPSTQHLARGCLQQSRPPVNITVGPVPYAAWQVFAPFHYLTAALHRSARCFGLWCDGRLASFAGMIFRPGRHHEPIEGCSRLVTLPDFQGLGLAFALIDRVAAIYKAIGRHVHTYPAHPALVRGFDKSALWVMRKRPGVFSPKRTISGKLRKMAQGGRPCAIFRYVGPAVKAATAARILSWFDR